MEVDINLLTDIGLTPDQAEIYLCLLQKGPQKGIFITKYTGIKRQMVYKCLDQLFDLGIIDKIKPSNSVTEFQAKHPDSLKALVDRKERALSFAQISFNEAHGHLSSLYNLSVGKPNVQFYEGQKGIKLAFEDLLTAQEEIYAYTDAAASHEHLKDINEWYVKERVLRKQKKKILIPSTEKNRGKFFDSTGLTEVRHMKNIVEHYSASLQIYDNKLLYVTITQVGPIIVIVNDKILYKMHRLLFESAFREADPL